MRAGLRLTELLARLHVFTGAPPRAPSPPMIEPVEGAPPPVAERVVTIPMRAWGMVPPGSAAAGIAGHHGEHGSLGAALAGLTEPSRASVLDPFGRARPPARPGRPTRVSLPFLADADRPTPLAPAQQVDETTCGSAVLTMLALAGDPSLALRVARDPARRFAALQHRVHQTCSRTGLVPWPMRFGTAPWAAAAVARFGDVRYTHRVVGGPGAAATLGSAVAAASSGIPVPLFTGGDLRAGWQAAVPRHVVLLVDARPGTAAGRAGGVVRIYEPSSATLHTVPTAVLLAPSSATRQDRAVLTAALGRWPHVVWAMLPR